MRERFSEAGFDLGTGDGPIVTSHFSNKDKLFAIVHGLYKRGAHTSAITYLIVESGRGRLRFIFSASYTRDHVDRALEALIEAEEGPGIAGDGLSDTDPGRSGVEAWANAFSTYLTETVARAPGSTPNLAVSVGFPDNGEQITIVFNEQAVTL